LQRIERRQRQMSASTNLSTRPVQRRFVRSGQQVATEALQPRLPETALRLLLGALAIVLGGWYAVQVIS
jgi:hypothetical protein